MKKHYLRAAFTSQEREYILNNLQDNHTLITIGFAQKYLPRWHREKQIDYFGKKGISYHISHVSAKIGNVYTQHSFVHIYDNEVSQDSRLVVLTLSHLLSELKKVGIISASIRSDNAGCYHSAITINALHYLMEQSGVAISTYTFSEAQNGKSSSDRDASRVKRKAEDYVAQGKDITTSDQFFTALKDGRPLNGMSIHYGSVKVDNVGNSKWAGISNLNHFVVEKTGIRGRRYGGIGTGIFMAKDTLSPMNGTYNFSDGGFAASNIDSISSERSNLLSGRPTKFWYYSECQSSISANANTSLLCVDEDTNVSPEVDDQESSTKEDIAKLFSCREIGCSANFLTERNLQRHILRGNHKISPERLTRRDVALKFFSKNIEEVEKTRTCPIVGDVLSDLKETKEQLAVTVGWALPKKQTRKPFEPNVKKFLIDYFEEGLQKKRLDPRTVEKRMKTETNNGTLRFSVDEQKDFRQIAGFFSREAEKRRSKHQHRHRRHKATTMQDADYLVLEDSHDVEGWIQFLKDESFWSEADEFFQAVQDHYKQLFLN